MSELNNKWANASKNLKMAWLLSIIGCITFGILFPSVHFFIYDFLRTHVSDFTNFIIVIATFLIITIIPLIGIINLKKYKSWARILLIIWDCLILMLLCFYIYKICSIDSYIDDLVYRYNAILKLKGHLDVTVNRDNPIIKEDVKYTIIESLINSLMLLPFPIAGFLLIKTNSEFKNNSTKKNKNDNSSIGEIK